MHNETAKTLWNINEASLDALAGQSVQLEFDNMPRPVFAISVESSNSEPQQVQFQNASTLLESLEVQEVAVQYQCRDGYCGACRCKKKSGEVRYLKEPMAWINEDEILPCVSIPTSDLTLEIKG